MMIKSIILVGIGGGIGSIFRLLTSVFINKYIKSLFPWGTFAANILGCILIGLFIGYLEKNHITNPDFKFFFVTGFCGGYTTFSAFALENVNLFHAGNFWTGIIYITISVVLGLLSVALGLTLGKTI